MKKFNIMSVLFFIWLLFANEAISSNTIKLYTEGQDYGVAHIDTIELSTSQSENNIYKTIHCQCPDEASVGDYCGSDNATFTSCYCSALDKTLAGKFVWSQFGCTPTSVASSDCVTSPGSVLYSDVPGTGVVYIRIRYSKHSASVKPIKIFINESDQIEFFPINQGDWNRFTTKVKVFGNEQEWIQIQLPAIKIFGSITDASGAGIEGVKMLFSGLEVVTTDSQGEYFKEVDYGWSGTVTPSKDNWSFSPSKCTYSDVTSDKKSENYQGSFKQNIISGKITDTSGSGIVGVTVLFSGLEPVTTDTEGLYSKAVDYGWSGTVTPCNEDLFFIPNMKNYTEVTEDKILQDYNEVKAIEISVDEYDKDEDYFYQNIGGTRGQMSQDNVKTEYVWDKDSSYILKIQSLPDDYSYTWAGMWNSTIRNKKDNIPLDFENIFGSIIKNNYQGRIIGFELMLNNAVWSEDDTILKLEVEFKYKNEVINSFPYDLENLTFPHKFFEIFDPAKFGKIDEINWYISNAQQGDEVSVDYFRLIASIPEQSTEEQAFLWSYSNLMYNYDSASGLFQDRSNFDFGHRENISATAKAAKNTAYAMIKEYVDQNNAIEIINNIANTLLTKVQIGPGNLWPHYTCKKGKGACKDSVGEYEHYALPPHDDVKTGKHWKGSEWSTGDTSFAALDLITALQMIGDPENKIIEVENFIKKINWEELLLEDNSISHGYPYEGGELLKNKNNVYLSWKDFGMETIGVNWAYASVNGKVPIMNKPPTVNGSGFILAAHYPLAFTGIDSWGNNWDSIRENEQLAQIEWYCKEPHKNNYLCKSNLFGLSAAETPTETPTGDDYKAYGIGGITLYEDGGSEIIVLHYSAMISKYQPEIAERMWDTLRDRSHPALLNLPDIENNIIISPLNNMESMSVGKSDGKINVNYLKGSWNLALQAEGWAQLDFNVRNSLSQAVTQNEFLKKGYVRLHDSGSINGKIITNITGQEVVVKDAAIRILRDGLIIDETVSDENGKYSFHNIPIDLYNVEIEKKYFKKIIFKGISPEKSGCILQPAVLNPKDIIDIYEDDIIGLEEVIYILQIISLGLPQTD